MGRGAMGMGPGGRHAGGMVNDEKAANFGQSMKKLVHYGRNFMPALIVALVLATAATLVSLVGPGQIERITDLILDGMKTQVDVGAVLEIAVLLIVIYSASLVIQYAQSFIMSTVAQRLTLRLRNDMAAKIDKLPFSYFDRLTHGDTLSRVINDVDLIGTSLNQSLSSVLTGALMIVGCLVMMLVTNVVMTVAGVLASLTGVIFMALIVRRSQKYFKAQQDNIGAVNAHIEENFSGHTVLKAYCGETSAQSTFKKINCELYESAWRSQFLSGLMMPVMTFVGNLSYVVVCIVGAVLALQGYISFGVVVAFILYIRMFSQPLATMAQAVTVLQSTAAAAERVFELLDEPDMPDETHKNKSLKNAKGDITFKNVHFGYKADKIIINDFSRDIKAGQKVAIVGPTGAGKTTLVNLLMRFYELNSGSIEIDGIPTTQLTRENVHELFGMVLQDTWLFGGTIHDNIAYNNTGIDRDSVERAAKAVGIDEYINTLPDGYDTVLDENTTLSQGQRQLVNIARAMVDNADMLILDEATSSVDTRTELLIQQAMDKLSAGKTSFIIAHRLSTIKNADVILVMKDGDVIESGSHTELISQKGFYAQLYNSQFEDAA